MARGAPKAADNVWYQARMEAAKWNDKLLSRSGAAEAVNMSEDAIKKTELGLEKCMPVEKAVLLADLYNAPRLLNYYCLHECPIGNKRSISDELVSIERVTVNLLKRLNVDQMHLLKAKLIDIASDGLVSDDEKPDLQEVVGYLKELAKTISQIEMIAEMALGSIGDG